jgi:hypothetical protein
MMCRGATARCALHRTDRGDPRRPSGPIQHVHVTSDAHAVSASSCAEASNITGRTVSWAR